MSITCFKMNGASLHGSTLGKRMLLSGIKIFHGPYFSPMNGRKINNSAQGKTQSSLSGMKSMTHGEQLSTLLKKEIQNWTTAESNGALLTSRHCRQAD